MPFLNLFSRSKSVFSKFNGQGRKTCSKRRPQLYFNTSASSLPYSSNTSSNATIDSILDNSSTAWLLKKGNNYLFGRDGYQKSQKLAVAYFEKAMALGSAKAEGVLGFCYEFGMGVETDFLQSEHHYIEAAKKNDGLSIARLAFLRKYGRPNVKIDRSEAEEWTERIRHKPDAIQWIVEAASISNDPAAQYALGVCYHDGISVPKDEHAAFRWYKASADQGNARGQGILGYCYGEGFGVDKDENIAMDYYRLAAAQGETVALYNIGYCYEDGIGVEKDPVEAVRYYKMAADQGNAFGQNSLGYCYEDGIGVQEDFNEAARLYQLSAEQGYPWAQCNLGYCYQNGIGVLKDASLSAYWYKKAALQGHARAQHNLGFCYQNGIGLDRDESKAIVWYKRSSERGNIFAYHSLGYCYQNGIGVPVNEQESFFWYYLSAQENHPPAQLSLGYCYRNGIGVSKNEVEACKWFRKSSENGNALAQNSLGFCYEEGIGVKKNPQKAAFYYMKSAKQNNPWAQCNLGFCYANGIGVAQSNEHAVYWYRKASAQNHARAQDKLGMHLQTGLGVDKDLDEAFRLFEKAAENDNISGQYHLANCYEKGLGCEVDLKKSMRYFERAALARRGRPKKARVDPVPGETTQHETTSTANVGIPQHIDEVVLALECIGKNKRSSTELAYRMPLAVWKYESCQVMIQHLLSSFLPIQASNMSAQLNTIEGLAESLNEFIKEPNSHEKSILQVIDDLGTELLSNMAEKNVDIVCSVLFKEDGPIFNFLSKCRGYSSGDLATAVSRCLQILCTFIKGRQSQFQMYAKNLMVLAKLIAKSGANALARNSAFDVLLILFDKSNKYDIDASYVEDCYKTFAEEYVVKGTPTVKAKTIELLGQIARYHSTIVNEQQLSRLKRWCFDNLIDQTSNAKKFEHATSLGYLNCLDSLIYRKDVEIVAKNSSDSDKLFHIILNILERMSNSNRYGTPIAALNLFYHHTKLFSNLLLPNGERLYVCLYSWAGHHNTDAYKFGLLAFEGFIKQLSNVLYHNIQGERELQTFYIFMARFNKILEQADNVDDMYKVSIAIRSVGYFAKILTKVKNTDVEAMRKSLVKISEWLYSDTNAKQLEYVRHLPAFIKAYTSFAQTMTTIPENLLNTLHHMCRIFIEWIPYATGYLRRSGCSNIYQLLLMLYKKGEGIGRSFAHTLFERALTFTATNIKLPNEDSEPVYRKLLYFWKVILDKPKYLTVFGIKFADDDDEDNLYPDKEDRPTAAMKKDLLDMLYDVFITNMMKIFKQFNLKVVNVAEDEKDATDQEFTDNVNIISRSLRPVNQKDFILFQNLVDFWSALVREINNKRLIQWVYIFGAALIESSVLHPMVSGFYRMLSEILVICEKERLFAGCEAYFSSASQPGQDDKESSKPVEYVTYLVYREYLKEVWHRLQQFTDELLASSLRLILAYPTEFFDITQLITPLEKALRLGVTYHPLATIAMNSLDKLLDPNLNYDVDYNFLSRILPCINEYLLIGVVSFTEQADPKKRFKAPTAAERRYKMVHTKATSDELGVVKQDYANLPELQRRMMQFLGRLGGKNKQLLAQGKEAIENNGLLAWDPVKKLKLRVPFMNVKVNIYLDEFLPRICELAESSPDRKVKIAACELLHGLVIYMIGNSAFSAKTWKTSTESLYHTYYERVFPVMLKLAIDADPIARDMYQFFYSQIIHWLTNNAHADNPETIALLQSLLDASCDADAGLRDYGAECIQEFVIWSIKQTSRSTDGAQNIKALLKRLYNLMASSSASKRFGASLVFNRIYRQFREESALVDEYTFEILGQLFLSLKMAETDHPSIGTRAQITEAINHITKIIERKADLFLKEKPGYRRPFIGANEVASLPQLVRWTFTESGSLQRNYVKLCISFFSKFVLLLPKVKTSKQWVTEQLDADPDFLVDIFETSHLQPPSILTDEDESHIVSIYLNWVKRLKSTLDAYIWLTERKIVDPKDILEAGSSHLLLAMAFFIGNKPSDYLEEKLNVNLADKSKIISMYTYISVRTIYFFDLVFGPLGGDQCFRYVERVFSDTLYHKNFMDVISLALILPKNTSEVIQSHHDNAITQSGEKRVFEIAQKFISTMIAKRSSTFIDSLASSISSTLVSSNVDLVLDTTKPMERSTLIEISQTVHGIKYLQSIDVLDRVCKKAEELNHAYPSSAFEYCEALLKTFLNQCKSAQEPLRIKLMGSMAVISFSQPGFAEKYSAKLLAFMIPTKRASYKEKIEIFQKFDKYMAECITGHVDVFSKLFKEYLTLAVDPEEDTYKTIHGYIMGLLDYLEANRLHERKLVWNFTDYLVKDESLLKTMQVWSRTDQQLLDVISCLKRLFGANPALMSRSKGKPIFGLIWDVFISFLRHGNFGVRLSALDLLPVFICLGEKDVKIVVNELRQNYINKLPPVQGKEYIKKGTVEYNIIISTLDKLLVPMVTFKSVALFDLLKVTFIQETHHIHEEAIKASIQKFSQELGLNSFLSITQSLMEFFKNAEYNIEHRNNIAQVLLVLLNSANEGHVVEFFKRHLCYIMGFISNGSHRDADSTDDLHMKANCLCFMQAYFNLISKNAIDINSSLDEIWTTSSENKDKKPVKAHILQTFKTLLNQMAHSLEELAEDRRNAILRYNQEAFNAFATYVLRASDNAKMYRALFTQMQRKPSGSFFYFWDELVDPTQPIYLEIQLSQPLVKKRLEKSSISSRKFTKHASALYYMDSIDIMGSSLSQSTFSEVVLEESQKSNEDDKESSSSSAGIQEDITMEDPESEESDTGEEKTSVDFEVDVLNDNTFMPMFTALIKQLHLNIAPPGDNPSIVPVWMNDLLEAFQQYDKQNEVKKQVYIAKLITNYPEAFEKFADSWILPLLKFVSKGNQFGESINYLVQDVCIILIIWGQFTPLPTSHSNHSKMTLYNCLNYLMENVYHPNHRVLRSNIQIIKGLYENWGISCPVPTLVGIVFSNGIYVYDDHDNNDLIDLPEDKFFYDLAGNLTTRGRSGVEIRNNAAELMGWSLKFMKERGSRCYEDMRETFLQKFIDLANDKNITLTNYLRCINRMYLHDLEMGQAIVNNVVLRLYFTTQEEKIMALEFINACYNHNEIIYGTLKKAGLNRMFSSKDEKLQTAALKIVNTMFDDMDGEAIGSIFRVLVRVFPEHRSAECRSLYYAFIEKTYSSIKFKNKVKMKAKAQLFRGLIDKDDAIALDIFNFVSSDLKIDDNIRATLLKITGDMYVSETEDIYLLYATRMILENTKKTYDFNEPIFQNSLTGAKMDTNYRSIDTAWHSSSSMQPLFVDSQAKSKKLNIEDIDMQLKRTQTLMEFTHTAGSSQSLVSTFNPASQNRLDIEYDEDDIFNEAERQVNIKAVRL
ncbi:hypothetical protein [Parasitella parasitica]|uniref:DNA-dependent protein kinase catalytic subunit CC3 domain-containing protein n=1 Tax=Parasitella parasitica TaxID=35722 RepID=A0A0B7NHW0_9FUNG|nr:hypothetical protein [Parasitella parasitica]